MSKTKELYDYWVVQIIDGGMSISPVTGTDYATRTFLSEKGKPPKVFSKAQAEDLVQGMIANCIPAALVSVRKDIVQWLVNIREDIKKREESTGTYVDLDGVKDAIRAVCKKYSFSYGGDTENSFAYDIAHVTDGLKVIGVDLAQKETVNVNGREVEVEDEDDEPTIEDLKKENAELKRALQKIMGIAETRLDNGN